MTVISPEKKIFKGEVTRITVPGIKGEFQILENHAPIVSALKSGEARYLLNSGEEERVQLEKGFIEVLNNEVSLLIQERKKIEEKE